LSLKNGKKNFYATDIDAAIFDGGFHPDWWLLQKKWSLKKVRLIWCVWLRIGEWLLHQLGPCSWSAPHVSVAMNIKLAVMTPFTI